MCPLARRPSGRRHRYINKEHYTLDMALVSMLNLPKQHFLTLKIHSRTLLIAPLSLKDCVTCTHVAGRLVTPSGLLSCPRLANRKRHRTTHLPGSAQLADRKRDSNGSPAHIPFSGGPDTGCPLPAMDMDAAWSPPPLGRLVRGLPRLLCRLN